MRLGLGLGLVRLGKAIASFVRDGLKLYYPFRDNNPELLLSGATSFDTTDDYIDLGDSADWDFGTGDWSFAHWIKITEDDAGYSIWRGTGGTRKWGMFFDHNNDQFEYLKSNSSGAPGGQSVASGNNTAPINNWYHVAYTRSSGTGSIYINGSLMNTVSNDVQDHNYSDSLILGNAQSLFTSKLMANVGIWNRALSASEIESIYWRGQYSDLKGTELTNLVSWYNLSANANDSTGTNNGTNNGATFLTDAYSASSPFLPRIQDKATPKGAVALASGSTSFDGSDDYIDIGDQQILTTAGTLSCWVKLDSNDSRNIINKFDSGAGKREYMLYTNASGHISFTVQDSAGSYDSNTDALSSTTLNTGIWYFISATFSTSEVAKLYVDGSLVASASASISDAIDNTNEPIYLGQGVNSGTPRNFFDGSIANVAIYSDAKTQSQIQDIMFSSYSTLTSELKTNLVSWYDLGSTELGSEKSPNVTFDSNITGWSGANWAWESDGEGGGRARHTAGSTAHLQSGNILTVGLQYEVSFTVGGRTAGSVFTRAGASGSGTSRTANGDYTEILTCLTNGIMYVSVSSDFDGYVDNVSFKPIETPDSQGDNEGSIYGATTNTGYTNSPSGVADPLNYGEIYGGNAVSFDGINDYIDCGTALGTDLGNNYSGSLSMSMWFKADTTSSNDGLFHIGSLSSASGEFEVQMYNNTLRFRLSNTVWWIQYDFTDTSSWHHLVCIYDTNSESNSKMYIDGVSVGSTNGTFPSDADMDFSGLKTIIGSFFSTSLTFDGLINNVKVFNTTLTQDQVRELYTKPELTLPTGIASSALKLDMPMQEGSGVAILDGSPTFLDVAVNGDFSADAVGSTSVTGWSLDDFTAEVIADGFSGNAVQLTRVDSGTQSFYQDLSGITSGNKYKINVKLKAIGGSVSAGIRVTTPTNSNPSSNIVSLPADGSWQDLELSFTAQGTTARIQIQRQESNPGSIVVDDVIINQLNLGQNHGTGNGITWATGQEYGFQHPLVRSNNPMVFDGSDDRITNSFDNLAQDATYSFWAKSSKTGSNAVFGHGALKKAFYFNFSSGRPLIYLASNYYKYWNDNSAQDDNQWHHYVVIVDVSDANGTHLYIDGNIQSVSSTVSSSPADAYSQGLTIGAQQESGSTAFDGIINEFAVWHKFLTANEITALYNSGLPLLPTADSGNYASADDLVGYWRNDGVTTWTDKANTGVASFDGTDDYIDTGNTFQSTFRDSFSFSAWIYLDDGDDSSSRHLMGSRETGSEDWIMIRLVSGVIQFYYASNNNGKYAKTNSAVFSNGATGWHHVVGVANNSTNQLSIYLNGSQQTLGSGGDDGDISSITMADFTTTRNLFIGARNNIGSASEFFDGMMSGTNIFNTALSATEVSELYAIDKRSSISGHSKFSNCVGSWLMGAGTGDTTSTIQDQTSNNNDATVSGANLIGYNDGTVAGDPASIIVPEGLNEGRDSQGYYLTDTDSISSGIRFKGAEYINVQDSESLDFGTSDFTLECWLKTTDQGFVRILDKRNSSSGYTLNLNTSEVVHLELNDGSGNTGFASSTAVNDGNWHHIAVSVNRSSNALFYIDGSLDATQNISAKNGSLDSTSNLIIGADAPNGDSLFLNGSIDEIKIYKGKVLSASEVLKNYNNGKSAHSN